MKDLHATCDTEFQYMKNTMHNHKSIQSCPSELNVLFIYGRIPSNMVGYLLFIKISNNY